ncbi:diguanylate cyclase (GGDEF)-like protein [Inhella inkyongensis]|uniref:diguanylate cyclase n=1 Tax=Inhella inkyongensis TaxID=392593 RepID=A0A840S7C3_9BURK|nr:GGDEF domain-containing protein [Inhella inkyongensis]MBB5204906.1 diguanylate cyclase (GGDEF)-like protein [Inhella inkyongensis]
MNLHLPTALLFAGLLMAALTLGLGLLAWRARTAYLWHWLTALSCTCVGLLLFAQRGQWPDWLTVPVANLLLMGNLLFTLTGYGLLFGERLPLRGLLSVVALYALATVWLTWGVDDFPARILSFNLTLAALSLIAAQVLRLQRGSWPLALLILPMGAHILQALLGLARVVLVLLGHDTGLSLPQVTQPHALLIMLTSLVALSLGFGFVTLHAGRLQRELNDQATTDPLTGLSNRRGFERALAREWRRRQRLGTPMAVLMLDIDHFKQINDSQGHAGGDQALIRMGEVLRSEFRPYDLIGRLGGEEFCVVLPGALREEALTAAERLRQSDWTYAQDPQGKALRYSLSIGVALADARDTDAEALLQRADTALYQAKLGGRDQVVLSQPPA